MGVSELQVLVNHYREDEATVRRFLSSLASQTGVDLEVLIASDGGEGLTLQQLSGYPFPISYAHLPHKGVCHTRNVLMDRADSEWIMFCDIDDEFSSDGLRALLDAAKGHDIAGTPYHVERPTKGGMSVGTIEHDTLRVHGKVFRRQYLIDNRIRFLDEMETGGDMAFLWLAYMLTDDVVWLDRNLYTWKWNPSSVTRSKEFFSFQAYESMLRCYSLLADDLRERGREDLRTKLIATVFATMYADYTGPKWWSAPRRYRDMAERQMSSFAREHIDTYRSADEALRRRCHDVMCEHKGGGPFGGMMNWAEHVAEITWADGGIVVCGR